MKKTIDPDLAALDECMKIARRNRKRAAQLDAMLKENSWHSVAEFAAYDVQGKALGLLPHEDPPCIVGEDEPSKAGDLLRRLLAAGLSRYEPDPLKALSS